MNVHLSTLIIGIVANIVIGLVVLLRNPKSATHKIFFFLSIDTVLWSIANYIALGTRDILLALYWTRIVMALAVPQAVLFFLLIHTLPYMRIRIHTAFLFAYAGIAIGTSGLCLSPYLFPSAIFVRGAPSPTPGPAMPVFVFVAVGSVIAAIVTLIVRVRHSHGIEKMQLQVVGIGVAVMFLLIVVFNFVLVIFFETSAFVSVSPLYVLPFVGSTAYAIARHKFLDIRFVVARAVSYTILISLFGLVYALVFALTSSLLISPFVDPKFIAVSTVAALVMLLTFPIAKRSIEKMTDSVFYKDRYDSSALLYTITKIMARTLRLEELSRRLLQSINREFQIEHSCVVLINDGKIFTLYSEGYKAPPEVPEHTASYIAAIGKVRLQEEEVDKQIMAFFASVQAAAIFPLETSKRPIGVLCVGHKQSGELLNEEDINTLTIIASEAAIAMENALSFEEIRRFNITLEHEISRATVNLRSANEKLQELDKLKDEFVSLASHELRTPLTSIRSYLWMALSGKGGILSEKQYYYLDRSFTSTNRLIKLVNDMLNISRIESGRVAVQFVRVSLSKLISEVMSEIQPKLEEKGLVFSRQGVENVPDIIADMDKIKEVLVNLIGNAVKFTPRGGHISLIVSEDSGQVRVTVADTGIGFDPGKSDKLFRKFGTLASASGAPQSPLSTGLGLYICKSIIAMHRGIIQARSEGEGRGASFSFTLPIYTPSLRDELQNKYPTEGLGIIRSSMGFTLIEVMITGAIIILMFFITTQSLFRGHRVVSLSETTNQLVRDLRETQLKSMQGIFGTGGISADRSVRFEEDRYILYSGLVYDSDDPQNQVVNLPASTRISFIVLPNNTITFARGSGDVRSFSFGQDSVTLTDVSIGLSKTVHVNKRGVVFIQ